ncbi:MAG: phosphatidate cytidylyltransferase [Bacteroidales bacterium]|nr:phosphatidate cytidylyltransferase [Bacteroidales bacterium]
MKELLLRTITGILLIVLVLGSILLGPLPFLIVSLLIYTLGLRELFPVYKSGNPGSMIIVSVSGGALLLTTYLISETSLELYWLALPVTVWLIGYLWSGFRTSGLLGFFWLALPLSSFFALGWFLEDSTYHHLLPLSVIILVWVNDTFAYLVGSLMGTHKMTPRLSPSKTWEGFLGGVLFTVLGGWIIFRITGTFDPIIWIACSLIISVLGLVGDLFESGLKRKKNVKNMGDLLPGHGGVLDRFDSLLFAAPVVLVLLILLSRST